VFCPKCQAERIPVLKKRIRDFAVVGEESVCPVCGTRLALAQASDKEEKPQRQGRSNAWSTLFGQSAAPEEKARQTVLDKTGDILRICRDCHWCVFNPFETLCSKHDRAVEPTDDCPDFRPRKQPPKEK